MNQRTLALIAVSIATLIYGITFTIAKDIMPNYVKPFGLILLRVSGAVLVFWTAGIFIKSKKIERKDFKSMAIAALFGVALNMLCYFQGLNLTTPISASVMMVTTPIIVLIVSSFMYKEKIIPRKILGIVVGLIGTIVLIIYGNKANGNASNRMLGNFLVFINAASYGIYLILAKKLIHKYHPIVFVKWFYLFGLIYVLPFGFLDLIEVDWATMPTDILLKVGFIILFTTCITYLFNLFGLKKLKPTTVSVFIYLQPVVATIYALMVGSDALNLIKIGSTILIFTGVYLVTKQVENSTK
ncbi:DMT family transporter [Polaribacter sp. Asnod1-A03]|uniref:DMT family transporter n=1 Tax=Polaribacter sp. Asnod1-A03 TaxID=3160581 RepID=UPI00386968A6